LIIRMDSTAYGAWPDQTGASTALVVNPLSNWWSYGLTLELASRLKKDGHRVHYLDLGPIVPNSLQVNSEDVTSTWRFKKPDTRINEFLAKQGIEPVQSFRSDTSINPLPNFETLSQLRSWAFEGKAFGAIISAAMSGTLKQRDFDVRTHAALIQEHVLASIQISNVIRWSVSELSPNLVGTTNDRLVGAGISLLESRVANIETLIAYWGSDEGRLVTYANSLYSPEEWRAFIAKKWESVPPTHNQLTNLDSEIELAGQVGFTSSQNFKPSSVSELNGTPKSRPKSLAFFATTPWEYSGLTQYPEGYFVDQIAAVRSILEILDPEVWTVFVRHHPPRRGEKPKAEVDSWESLRSFPNLVEIAPDSQVDSYKLMDESDINAVWVSTLGAESIARGKRTLVLGRPYWLDPSWSCATPTPDALGRFLEDMSRTIDPSLLRPYLHYVASNGTLFQFMSGVGPERLRVGGIRLYPRKFFGMIVSLGIRGKRFWQVV